MGFVKGLLQSRKFWLMVGAIVVAATNGQVHLIPGIILAEMGAITIEDAAEKVGVNLTKKG